MSYGVVSPGHPSRGYNQMLPPARKRGCLAELRRLTTANLQGRRGCWESVASAGVTNQILPFSPSHLLCFPPANPTGNQEQGNRGPALVYSVP